MQSNLTIKEGNLLDAKEKYLGHQCNCTTIRSKHLAQQVFEKYPYANTYKNRSFNPKSISIPGTIDIFENDNDQKYIINIYAQYYPGGSKYNNDSYSLRMGWFKNCLDKISQIPTSPVRAQ